MGAIQNSLNQALGAVAGAAIGIGHVKAQSEQKTTTAENQALVAEGEAGRATEEANAAYNKALEDNLPGQLAEAEIEYGKLGEKAEKAKERFAANPTPNRLTRMGKAISEAEAAERAFGSLKDQYDGVIARMNRAAALREHAASKRREATDIRAKHESKWGKK